MKITEILAKYRGEFSSYEIRELVKFSENLSDEELIFRLNSHINLDKFEPLLEKLRANTPLEYITNRAQFLGSEFFVDERVLIPRFESEILVEKVIQIARNFENLRICEIGVGSGIISISLKIALKNARIIATDLSKEALEVARINAKNLGVEIEFVNTNLMDFVSGNFDIIISNPPYIKNSYKLDEMVLKEPKMALFGGDRGDEILQKIIEIAKTRTKFLACEIGYDQREFLASSLREYEHEFYKDLAGFDRGFVVNFSKRRACV